MGGCYRETYSSPCSRASRSYETAKPRAKPNPKWKQELKKFASSPDISELVAAHKSFFRTRTKGGFFAKLAEACGIKKVEDIPNEFPKIEYEVKFDVKPCGKGNEPAVVDYLNAFDFPVGANARFLKDPVNNFAVGINHFIGDNLDEKLVVIEKCGGTYLKEKGKVVPTNTGIPYEEMVIKRTENRYAATMDEIIAKTKEVTSEKDVEYKGKIRKEKGDAFILDTNDGRLYSFTITRAHMTKAGEQKESGIQRQLEIEYAGYIPGFKGFEKNSEAQLVQGMIDLAKYTYAMYNNAPITNGWRMSFELTSERKYDFVNGSETKQLPETVLPVLTLPKQRELAFAENAR
jgi:hypothetical protein